MTLCFHLHPTVRILDSNGDAFSLVLISNTLVRKSNIEFYSSSSHFRCRKNSAVKLYPSHNLTPEYGFGMKRRLIKTIPNFPSLLSDRILTVLYSVFCVLSDIHHLDSVFSIKCAWKYATVYYNRFPDRQPSLLRNHENPRFLHQKFDFGDLSKFEEIIFDNFWQYIGILQLLTYFMSSHWQFSGEN